ALTLTPMLCAFFLNVHHRLPRAPRLFGWPLAVVVGVTVAFSGAMLRLGALAAPVLGPLAWWPATLTADVAGLFGAQPLPAESEWTTTPSLWIAVTVLEFALAALLMRFGNRA